MKSTTATEQLLVSDAIERSVDSFDFSPLAGQTVFLDTQYMSRVTSQVFLNSDYIRSCLREHLMLAGCRLKENRDEADVIIEVRVGALGTDGHEVNYGVPANQPLNSAVAAVSGTPMLPVLPEVSLAKKDERRAAAKIHLFAYHRESLKAMWAPGSTQGESIAKSTWVLGAGPFEQGSIYDQTQFAGAPIVVPDIQPLVVETPFLNRIQRSLRDVPLMGEIVDRGPPAVETKANEIQTVTAEMELDSAEQAEARDKDDQSSDEKHPGADEESQPAAPVVERAAYEQLEDASE